MRSVIEFEERYILITLVTTLGERLKDYSIELSAPVSVRLKVAVYQLPMLGALEGSSMKEELFYISIDKSG